MYYIAINKDKAVHLGTSRKGAAKHIGITSMTLFRTFKIRHYYEGSKGVVYITDSLIKQRRGSGGVRFKSVRKP